SPVNCMLATSKAMASPSSNSAGRKIKGCSRLSWTTVSPGCNTRRRYFIACYPRLARTPMAVPPLAAPSDNGNVAAPAAPLQHVSAPPRGQPPELTMARDGHPDPQTRRDAAVDRDGEPRRAPLGRDDQ